jgi:hypothetical protein
LVIEDARPQVLGETAEVGESRDGFGTEVLQFLRHIRRKAEAFVDDQVVQPLAAKKKGLSGFVVEFHGDALALVLL